MPFFSDNLKKLNLYNCSDEGHELRDPQIGAYQAVCSHFTCCNEIASVIIPTGVGKTAIMTLLPFGLKAKRVLVVAPSNTVRGQIYTEFKELKNLAKLCIFEDDGRPKVKELKKSISSDNSWEELKNYEVIISNPHCISSKFQHVSNPSEDIRQTLFDLIIIDEAHHIPAETWENILKQFPTSKQILFTATPFRSDGKKLPGIQAYTYPLVKAIEKGYYGEIEYVPLEINPNEDKDLVLANTVKDLYSNAKASDTRIKLLIKTDTKDKTKKLKAIYDAIGIKTEIISSKNTYTTNSKIIKKLKESTTLDGAICVDMLGEGFDLPEIKLAVLHEPPKSLLPFVQFVGRIARIMPGNTPKGFLIADKKDFSNEISKLTDDYQNLSKLIPNLLDSLATENKQKRSYYTTFETDRLMFDESIDLENIYPSFSITLYSVKEEYINFKNNIKLTGSVTVKEHQSKDNLTVFITSKDTKPKWTKSGLLKSAEYHLNVFYYDKEKGILFHHNTDENVANDLLKSFCADTSKLKKLNMVYIFQLMQKALKAEYINVGVKNPLNLVGGSYENYMGKDAQNSISIMQSNYQCLGHAFGKLEFQDHMEFRGISPFNAKVWSFQRGDIQSFHEWCKKLSKDIDLNAGVNFELPNLPIKANLMPISRIQGNEILCLIHNQDCYRNDFTLKTTVDGTSREINNILDINIKLGKLSDTSIEISLYDDDNLIKSIKYDVLDTETPFKDTISMESDPYYISKDNNTYKIEEFFNKYSPMIITDDGESLMGNVYFKITNENYSMPYNEIFETVNWKAEGVDIKQEIPFASESETNKSIFTYVSNQLKEKYPQGFIIKDDGSGEVADFIVVNNSDIIFYHCKASTQDTSGLRVKEFYEVIGQAIRSNKWVRNNDLFNQLSLRINKSPSRLIQGELANLKAINKPLYSYNYKICVIQPGLSYKTFQESSSNEVKKLICLGYDIIKHHCEYKIICNI